MTWCLNMPASQMAPWHPNYYGWPEPALGRPQELGLASWWGSPMKSQSQLQGGRLLGRHLDGSVLRHPYTLYTSSWGNRTSDSEQELKEKGSRGFHRGTEQKWFPYQWGEPWWNPVSSVEAHSPSFIPTICHMQQWRVGTPTPAVPCAVLTWSLLLSKLRWLPALIWNLQLTDNAAGWSRTFEVGWS